MPDLDALLDALHHVVDREGGDARGHERFHLDARRPDRRRLGPDPQGGGGAVGRDRDHQVGQRQGVAQRDQVGGLLAAHDSRDLGDGEDVALRATAVDDQAQCLLAADDLRLGDGTSGGDRLGGDVHHPRAPAAVHVGQPAAIRPGLRSLVHATSVPGIHPVRCREPRRSRFGRPAARTPVRGRRATRARPRRRRAGRRPILARRRARRRPRAPRAGGSPGHRPGRPERARRGHGSASR